jgi:hypothetical protein
MKQRRFVSQTAQFSIIGGIVFASTVLLQTFVLPTAADTAGVAVTSILLIATGSGLSGIVTGFLWIRHIWTKCVVSGSLRQKISLPRNLLLILAIVFGGQLVTRFLPTEVLLAMGYAFGSFGAFVVFGTSLFERTTRSRIWMSISSQQIEYRLENLSANGGAA